MTPRGRRRGSRPDAAQPSRRAACARSGADRRPPRAVASTAMPTSGFAINAVPACRPPASWRRTVTERASTAWPRCDPCHTNDAAGDAAVGTSCGTRSWSAGSTSAASASRPPGVSARTSPPSAREELAHEVERVRTAGPAEAEAHRLGAEIMVAERDRCQVRQAAVDSAEVVGRVDEAPVAIDDLPPSGRRR